MPNHTRFKLAPTTRSTLSHYQGGGGKPEAFARYTPPPRAGPGPLVVSSSFSCVLSSCGPSVGERHGGRSRRGKDEAPLGTVCDWWDIQGSAANSVCVYDPQADAWTQLASMSIARRNHASAAVGGKLYVFGGFGTDGCLGTAEVYDPASDSWAQASSLTSPRDSLVAVAF